MILPAIKKINKRFILHRNRRTVALLLVKGTPNKKTSIYLEMKMNIMNTAVLLSRCAILTLCRNGYDSVKFHRLVTVRMKV